MKSFVCMLLTIFLLCGCAYSTNSTVPFPTNAPEETMVTSLELQDLSQFQSMLNYGENTENWIPFALGCIFESPQDIDLDFMFYQGIGNLGWHSICKESEQELIAAGFMREMDLQVMPVDSLESVLKATFGITLAETSIPDSWYYLSAENAYCTNNNDAYFVGHVTVTSATEYSDGTTVVHYNVGSYYNTKTCEFYDCANLILTLKDQSGCWLVYSNLVEGIG